MATPAQAAANRANAQFSTGPTSESGRATSSLNALKSGLTGRTVLLPTEDVAPYEALLASVTARYLPVGPRERAIAQSIANHEWRLSRIPNLELGIYAMGHMEFGSLYANQPEDVRSSLIEMHTFRAYQRQLNNLSIQENRLRRNREKDVAELAELQAPRQKARQRKLDAAAFVYIQAVEAGTHKNWKPEQFGFEFSIEDVEVRALDFRPGLFDKHHEQLRAEAPKAS